MPRFPFTTLSIQSRSVKRISDKVDILSRLAVAPTFPWLPKAVKSEDILPTIKETAPVDGREIVDWMQRAAAEAAVLDGTCEDYNRLGSLLIYAATDPYLPGIRCGDLTVRSISGASVQAAGGTTIMTPRGNFNVALPGKATGIFSDILAWARLSWAGSIQWLLSLLQWKDLAKTPINSQVRFVNLGGAVAPHFATVSPRVPAPLVMMRIGMTTDTPQSIEVKGRSLSDYTGVLFSDKFDIDSGESETLYGVLGFPFVGDFLLEMQPQDNTQTVLDYIETIP